MEIFPRPYKLKWHFTDERYKTVLNVDRLELCDQLSRIPPRCRTVAGTVPAIHRRVAIVQG